jgi:hypothetical protein
MQFYPQLYPHRIDSLLERKPTPYAVLRSRFGGGATARNQFPNSPTTLASSITKFFATSVRRRRCLLDSCLGSAQFFQSVFWGGSRRSAITARRNGARHSPQPPCDPRSSIPVLSMSAQTTEVVCLDRRSGSILWKKQQARRGCQSSDLTLGDGGVLYVAASRTLASPNKLALLALNIGREGEEPPTPPHRCWL